MRNYLFVLPIAIFMLLHPGQGFSQTLHTIKGNVYNTETGEPVSSVNIAVVNTTTGTSTDEQGNFELRLTSGRHQLRFTSVEYAVKEMEIALPPENNKALKIGLQPKKQEIEGVDIYGNYAFPERDTSINMAPLSILPAITRVSALEIEKQGAVTLTDALKYVPGGWTETRGRKSKQFFSVRGQKYPYPDYSIDGIWQKEFEETAYVLSALEIESIEIVRSSNALVKGLSGLTGVIEVKTKKPERESVSLLTKYGQYNNYATSVQYGNKINRVAFNTGASFFGTDGIPDRGGKERMTNLHGNMHWELSKKLTLVAGATYISGMREFVRIVEPGSPNILNRQEKFDPLQTWVSYAKLNYRGDDGSRTELQVNYTFRDANYQNYNIQQESTTTHHDKDWEYGLNLLHSRQISESNTLRIGALYNHWVAPDGKRYYAGRRCDLETWSWVIADEQKIGNLILNGGFRLIGGYINEWGGFGIEGSAAGFNNVVPVVDQAAQLEWQSAIGGSYILSPVSSVHYNFSGGTIAPRNGTLNSDGVMPESETRFQHDAGFRFTTRNQSRLTVSAFYNQRKDALDLTGETVVSDNDLLVELYGNLDKRNYGVEMAANMNIPLLQSAVFANAILMKNEKEADNNMVDDSKLPNVILNGGIIYDHAGIDANLFIHYTGPYSNNRFVNPAWVAENGAYPLGDYVTADFTCGYTFPRKIKIRIFMEVKNILDVKYETVAGYPDLGRLLQGGIKLDLP
jgi:iron complex outermembrane receptor protein